MTLAATGGLRVREAWLAAGRQGSPEFRVLSYFALGKRAESGRDYPVDSCGRSVLPLQGGSFALLPVDAAGSRRRRR